MQLLNFYDPKSLMAVSPSAMLRYVEERGWQQKIERPGIDEVWQFDESGEYFVSIPLDSSTGDYTRRVRDFLRTVESAEQRPMQAIYSALISDNSIIPSTEREDILRLRALHPDAEDGTIPLKDAAKLYEGAFRMVEAAASVVLIKRRSLPSHRPFEANQYLDQTRIGPSERGSYVMVIHSPLDITVEDKFLPADKTQDNEGFGRRVLTTLAEALTTLKTIASDMNPDQAGESEVETHVEHFVETGGTAELCEAVDKLHESTHEQRIELNFTWSQALPVNNEIADQIVLDERMTKVTQRLQTVLKRRVLQEIVTVKGRIVNLKEEPSVQGVDITVVTLETTIDEKNRHVRLYIRNDEERTLCYQASQQRKRIRCTGRFAEHRTYNILENHHDLEIEESK